MKELKQNWIDTPEYIEVKQLNLVSERFFACKNGCIVDSKRGCVVKMYLDKDGYKVSGVRLMGKTVNFREHRIIAQTFIPNPENKPQVNHKNGIKTDNRVENLEWVTCQENIIHSFKNGLSSQLGSKNACSKFTNEQIIEIKNKMNLGYRNIDLCKEYNMSDSNMAAIRKNKRWGHIKI